MKKWLSLLLVLCLGTGILCSVSAEEGTERETLTAGNWEYQVLEDGTVTITRYKNLSGETEDLLIPETLGGKQVTAIAPRALFGCDTLKTVTIPDCVTSIGDRAFQACKNLTEASIGNGVTAVGENLFARCTALTAIHIAPDHPYLAVTDGALFIRETGTLHCYPAGLEASEYTVPQDTRIIGEWAFAAAQPEKITIPDSVQEIGERAFYECGNLKEITIPDGVPKIGDYTFGFCSSLADVLIPDSVTAIGANAFERCGSLAGIIFPDNVVSLGDKAFSSCPKLTEILLPDSVASIGNQAFTACTNLAEVTLGNGVTSIGMNPFADCPALIGFRIAPDHPYLAVADGALFIREPCTLVCYPGGLEAAEYTVPQDTRIIGEWAFSAAPLGQVTIPDSVETIRDDAFDEWSEIILIVGSGSAAEQYCEENDLTYRYPEEAE